MKRIIFYSNQNVVTVWLWKCINCCTNTRQRVLIFFQKIQDKSKPLSWVNHAFEMIFRWNIRLHILMHLIFGTVKKYFQCLYMFLRAVLGHCFRGWPPGGGRVSSPSGVLLKQCSDSHSFLKTLIIAPEMSSSLSVHFSWGMGACFGVYVSKAISGGSIKFPFPKVVSFSGLFMFSIQAIINK